MQSWRQWQETVEENKAARVALSFFAGIATRKAFNQWLAWAQERQEFGAKMHLAVQASLPHAILSYHLQSSCQPERWKRKPVLYIYAIAQLGVFMHLPICFL